MTIELENKDLTPQERESIEFLLNSQNPQIHDDLEQIWYLMNKVWDEMGCDNKNIDWDKLGKYYSHPVWLLNGLFIENHDISIQVRENIADYIAKKDFQTIVDYGGGFGTLAKAIAKKSPDKQIFIYEPFPSEYGKRCVANYPNIDFISKLESEFDCIIATDVLEHLEDPLESFEEMLGYLKINGEAIIGNCFYPCIKCHLPQNFHYRYSFDSFAKFMGLKNLGILKNTYATIFLKTKNQKLNPTIKTMGGGDKQNNISHYLFT
ncbi:class I SAM-dependent methyltransferase [Helicobacter cappadocius]|uniref:Methyltransferase domain-containing protein n=1 Tax=Helicobacter cappadocius TaxID=3063998 RepID=A0AA90Q3L9_9HELI|nr:MULTISPECIES: methyltransferase domain-containing protein [unclassified Helicobacter]MDO7253605.1 methyltransferase domain-containing protein [Helicobacter sp. faydin-H75]MDP2539533.1 methyltransferase domain-containing protein [Helicobacter sp. faydin-H76]